MESHALPSGHRTITPISVSMRPGLFLRVLAFTLVGILLACRFDIRTAKPIEQVAYTPEEHLAASEAMRAFLTDIDRDADT
jgi:hypothetical protein